MTETKIIDPSQTYKPGKEWVLLIETEPMKASASSVFTANGKDYFVSDLFRRKIKLRRETEIEFNGLTKSFISVEADQSDELGDIRLYHKEEFPGQPNSSHLLPFITKLGSNDYRFYIPAFTTVYIQSETGVVDTLRIYPKRGNDTTLYYLKTLRLAQNNPETLFPFRYHPVSYKVTAHLGNEPQDVFVDGKATLIFAVKL